MSRFPCHFPLTPSVGEAAADEGERRADPSRAADKEEFPGKILGIKIGASSREQYINYLVFAWRHVHCMCGASQRARQTDRQALVALISEKCCCCCCSTATRCARKYPRRRRRHTLFDENKNTRLHFLLLGTFFSSELPSSSSSFTLCFNQSSTSTRHGLI